MTKPAPNSQSNTPVSTARRQRPHRAWWILIFAIALATRAGWGGVAAYRGSIGTVSLPDEVQYWDMAKALRAGEGLPDELGFQATRMPLYPGLLACFAGTTHGIAYTKMLQWLLGAACATLTACLAAHLFDRRIGIVAGLLVACDPYLVFFSSLLLTETVAILSLLLLWTAVARWTPADHTASAQDDTNHPKDPRAGLSLAQWLLVGAMTALCVHARESNLGLIMLLVALLAWHLRKTRWSILGPALAICIMIASLVPWAHRNAQVTGNWCFLTHRGGISLYDGVRVGATGASDLGEIKQMPAVAQLDEVAWNQYFTNASIKAVRDDPIRIAHLATVKMARTWSIVPNADGYQSGLVKLVSAGFVAPVFAFAVAGVILLVRRWRAGGSFALWLLLLPAVYISMVHSIFVGSVRYRLVAMPMIEILAALAVVTLVEAWLHRPGEQQR